MINKVYITGFMGSGKTTTGKKLAAILGWKVIDLDQEIEKAEGKPVPLIFSENGEDYFRKIEAEMLRNIKTGSNAVISAGGGTPCFHGNMDYMLSTGTVVYLKLEPQQILSRLRTGREERPLIKDIPAGDLPGFIAAKLSEREKYYNMAQIIVSGYDVDIYKLADKISDSTISGAEK